MSDHNAVNERTKRRYFVFLKEAYGYSEQTIDEVAKALSRFETHTNWREFSRFHFEQAIAFKRHLAETQSQTTGGVLSKATSYKTLSHLKRFFHWLADQPGFRSRLQYSDANYFNLSEKDVRIAHARLQPPTPTLEQIHNVLSSMPSESLPEKRDRALIAFAILTGARDAAIASMKLKHVRIAEDLVLQDAREVRTKFSKTFVTAFFPVGGEAREILVAWVELLRRELLWADDDPIFPATNVTQSEQRLYKASGLRKGHWSTAAPIRNIFRDAFESAGLPYFQPHSFRRTLALLGGRVCRTAEQFKAWSQNLGHEGVLTTFVSYGTVSELRQKEILREIGEAGSETLDKDLRISFSELEAIYRARQRA